MILTGKAKIDFGLWHFENCNVFEYKNFHNLSELLQYAIIIDWLDSVGIIVSIRWEWSTKTFPTSIFSNNNTSDIVHLPHHDERQKATEQAIIKANEIYNQKELI